MFRSGFHWGLIVVCASTLGAQEPDTVADSIFLAHAQAGWPERSAAFGEQRLWASPSLRAQAARCRDAPSAITRDSIGPVRPGMTLADLNRLCPRVLHVWEQGGGQEERHYPIIAVTLGHATVFASVEDTASGSRLSTIYTTDSGLQTLNGIGVGSTYAQLRATYGASTLAAGSQECGAAEAKVDALPGVYFEFPWRNCEDPTENESQGLRVSEVIVPRPTPAEVAEREPRGPESVADSAFAAATSVTWPRPSRTYRVERVPPGMVPACVANPPVITADSIGPIAIGEPVAELRQRCPRMLYVWELERFSRPAVFVRLGGAIVWAFVADTLPASPVNFIQTVDSTLRTTEGIGVGVDVIKLFAEHQDLALIAGPEPALRYCQLSFRSLHGLSFSLPVEACKRRNKHTGRFPLSELLPPGTRISGVQVRGSR